MTSINSTHFTISNSTKTQRTVIISNISKAIGIVLFSMVSLSSFAQDAIARQAPSDRRLKDIRNVKLNNTAALSADLNNPAANIYTDWTENIRGCSGVVPANYKIDLRGFCMPTPSRKVNSLFGPRWGRQHEGLDIKVYIGDTIRAAFDGKVRICKYNGRGYGYYLVLRHPNGLETLYGHLSKQLVKKDQIVRAGEPIGLGGNTGKSSGSHLHFETRVLGQPINPALLFDFEHQDVTSDFYVIRNGIRNGSLAARTANQMEANENQHTMASAANTNDRTTDSSEESAETKQNAVNKQSSRKKTNNKAVSYSVKKGDTLFSIARQHGTTVEKLCRLNGIKSTSILRTGQIIKCS